MAVPGAFGAAPLTGVLSVVLFTVGCAPAQGGGVNAEQSAPTLTPAARNRVVQAVSAPTSVACDTLADALAAEERLAPAAARLLARSLAIHGGAVVRWPSGAPPIRVWVQTPPLAARGGDADALRDALRRETFVRAARDAVADWDGAAPGIRLHLVPDSAEAAVVVTWARQIAPRADTPGVRPAGRSGVLRSATTGAVEAATVVLATLDADGAPHAARDMHAVAIHEIGHVLGLAELRAGAPRDSPTPVMTADVAADEVTAADRAALRIWYALPVGPLCRTTAAP